RGPAEALPSGPIFRVSRWRRGDDRGSFDSLAAACAAAPLNQETVIEIHDNGPLFERPVRVIGRSLVVRAGQGYRPLLAWESGQRAEGEAEKIRTLRAEALPAASTALLAVAGGNLTLEDLDIAIKGSDAGQGELASLVQVTGGDVQARGCTFSVAGKHRLGMTGLRLEGIRPDGKPCKARLRCCYARGAEFTALEVRAPSAEILLENCLLVGGSQPLVDVLGQNAPPATLRILRSTLVASQTLLRVRSAAAVEPALALHWHSWDTLLACARPQPEAALVTLPDGAGVLQWRAVNCLYAGWPTLVAMPGGNLGPDLDAWHRRWNQTEGDALLTSTWPPVAPADPWETPPRVYGTANSPVAFAATSGPGALGCDVTALPRTRDN
ncbi:MAG: hypothetical protein L0Z62_07230, partial [Gemmataceae bacterium]|nr:hypothetical protein [Gemmataceae bacterium]